MKISTLFLLLAAAFSIAATTQAQVDTLWRDTFSDGDYTNNWAWTVTSGSAQVANGSLILSGGAPYNDANASSVGDPARPHPAEHYSFYVTLKIQGSGTPAAVLNVKDDAATFYLIDLYPSNNGIYLLRGVYPNPADYKKWVTGVSEVRFDSTMNVGVEVNHDTIRVKVWSGPVEPTTWNLSYDSASTSSSPWPGIQIGGWWLDNAILVYDDITCVSYTGVTSAERERSPQEITRYGLSQNYPNPFNPSTTIEFQIPQREHVKLEIFDCIGRLVATPTNQELASGRYRVRWSGINDRDRHLPSGMYIYRLTAGPYAGSGKMLLLK